jgi:hypothetical protein
MPRAKWLIGAVVACLLPMIAVTSISASPKPRPKPVIKLESLTVTPSHLSPNGGTVKVSGKFTHGRTCQLMLTTKQPFAVVYSHAARICTDTWSAKIVITGKPTRKEHEVVFVLKVANKSVNKTALKRDFAVFIDAAVAATTTTTTTRPRTITTVARAVPITTAPGSTVPALPAPPSPPAIVPVSTTVPVGTTTTTTSLATTTSSTTTTTATGPTTTGTTLAGATTTTSTTIPTATTSTTAPAIPVVPYTSDNWSGYALAGGPFTVVSSTFNVTAQVYATSCGEDVAEWVGIGGFDTTTLIQAGVEVETVGPCVSGEFYVYPWWEELPAGETVVTNWNDGTPATVSVGDSITASIQYIGSAEWSINVTDNTTGKTFSTESSYYAPGSAAMPADSAEYITEANYAPLYCDQYGEGGFCPLAGYAPPITFTSLSEQTTGSVTAVNQLTMVQGFFTPTIEAVSTPSGVVGLTDLLQNGFTTSYTGPADTVNRSSLARAGADHPMLTAPVYSIAPGTNG